jgi:hypothetical protein
MSVKKDCHPFAPGLQVRIGSLTIVFHYPFLDSKNRLITLRPILTDGLPLQSVIGFSKSKEQ